MKWLMNILRRWYLKKSGLERLSPNDWIRYDQIVWLPDTKILTISGLDKVEIFGVADTGSMDGLMDYGHNVILTRQFDKDKLAVGDIIAYYQAPYTGKPTLHRIVEMGTDNYSNWYHTRGDNNIETDPYHIRAEHIVYLCIGILY